MDEKWENILLCCSCSVAICCNPQIGTIWPHCTYIYLQHGIGTTYWYLQYILSHIPLKIIGADKKNTEVDGMVPVSYSSVSKSCKRYSILTWPVPWSNWLLSVDRCSPRTKLQNWRTNTKGPEVGWCWEERIYMLFHFWNSLDTSKFKVSSDISEMFFQALCLLLVVFTHTKIAKAEALGELGWFFPGTAKDWGYLDLLLGRDNLVPWLQEKKLVQQKLAIIVRDTLELMDLKVQKQHCTIFC